MNINHRYRPEPKTTQFQQTRPDQTVTTSFFTTPTNTASTMRITETLSLAALAATTLLGVVGAHGNPTTGELAARDIRESRARRSLAQCSEKLRARDRLHKRSSKRNALVERHLLKKRQVGGGSRGGQGQNQGQGGQQPGGGQQGGNNGGNQGG